MNSYEYILSKQIQWAFNNDIKLVGSKGTRGRLAYTRHLDDNLFQPLGPEVKGYFEQGDGGELIGKPDSPPKMHAVHSSSALGVNIFQYWESVNQVTEIAAACGLCNKNSKAPRKIEFEKKFPISHHFQFSPNIDVVIKNSSKSSCKVFAIECKFSEAYSSHGHSGIDPKYLKIESIWEDLPNLHSFSESICPDDTQFSHLHPSQLVKHILGLKAKYGKNKFRLLYLWYDCIGYEGSRHKDEIDEFKKVTKADTIRFHSLSYQELIIKLAKEYRDSHADYIKYITSRYL